MTTCRTALLCLLLALLAPVGAGAAEDNLHEPRLLSPQTGELITGPLVVHAITTPATGGLELRVLRAGSVLLGPDEMADSTVTDGERHWRAQLDLSPLPNGLATVQVRPSASTPGAGADWTGVTVLLSPDLPTPTAPDVVPVPVESEPEGEPVDESPEATPEPRDTRVRATGGSEPRQVDEPVPAEAETEAEPAPSPPRERNAAMRRTAASQEVGTAVPQVAAPQVAAPETAPPEQSPAAQALARPSTSTLTIGHPDRLVAEQGSLGPLLAMLLAGLMLARRTRRSARS